MSGTDKFRRAALIGTLISAGASMLILAVDTRECDTIKLEYGVYICAGVHLLTFLMLLSSYMCTRCVVSLGRCMIIFYFAIVGSMVSV